MEFEEELRKGLKEPYTKEDEAGNNCIEWCIDVCKKLCLDRAKVKEFTDWLLYGKDPIFTETIKEKIKELGLK